MADDNADANLERLNAAVPLILEVILRLRDVPGLTREEAALCLETAAKAIRQTEGWPATVDVPTWEDPFWAWPT